jgi:two-component system, LuxR family, sensor kinase FixL
MNWVTISWPMVAAACLTLGMIELRVGIAQQSQRAARLLFALSACAMAAAAGLELALAQVDTTARAEALLFALGTTVGVMLLSLMAYVWVYFGTGSKWLALAVPVLYAIGLVGELFPGQVHTYSHTVSGLASAETFGGVHYTKLERVLSFWNTFTYLATLMMIVFVADASARLYRRGGRRRALVVGGSVVFFLMAGGVHTALVSRELVSTPYMISWAYLAILVAMASELNADVLASARLATELRESEHRIDLASAAADLGMWSWDVVDGSIWATSRARALFGIGEGEPLSMDRFMLALHPDDRDARRRAIEGAFATGTDYEVEFRVPLADGTTRWISSRGRVERDVRGKPVILRGAVQDISVRRAGENESRELRSQLAHASRVSMMGQLASSLAHELSQPLGAILRNTEAAELFLQHESPDLDELRAILADIRQDDQRAGEVIERLRALLKRRVFEPRALQLNELLASVAALMRLDSASRHVPLEVDLPAASATVTGDPIQLQQVLLNLVLNAFDSVGEVAVERRKVSIHAMPNGKGEIEVSVVDTGPGIAPDRLDRLFEPFFTTKAHGLGIGLSISRTIVEAHGGRLWAENNARAGAAFHFTLPLAKSAVPS